MRFKELSTAAKRVAVNEFIVDFNCFFKEDEDDFCSFIQAYEILMDENEYHEYDSEGI